MRSDLKLMVVASAGGHWVQLLRMRKAWDGMQVIYMTTDAGLADLVKHLAEIEGNAEPEFVSVVDANLRKRMRLLRELVEVFFAVVRHRPDVILTTGAAVGYFALRFGKLIGARTIWVDSIANAEELSIAGKNVRKYADLWLTQWKHLARPEGPYFIGAVL